MTGSDLAERISRRLNIPSQDARVIVREFFSAIVLECLSVPRLELRRFGTFSAVRRRPRPARDFRSGKPIVAPDRLTLKFKPARELVLRVNLSPRRLPTQPD